MSSHPPRVEVALPLPVDQTFTYELHGDPSPPLGTRVLVPFRQTERIGWIVGSGDPARSQVRKVLAVLDREPSFPAELLRLTRWIADYYVAPPGLALKTALPAALSDSARHYVTPVEAAAGEARPDLPPRAGRLLQLLRGRPGPQRVATLRKAFGKGSIWPEIRILEEAGVVHHELLPPREPRVRLRKVVRIARWLPTLDERDSAFARAPRQRDCYQFLEAAGGVAELSHVSRQGGFARAVVRGLEAKGLVSVADEEVSRDPFAGTAPRPPQPLTPNAAQARAIAALLHSLDEERPSPYVLHGITGSGKTLVYIELLKEVVLVRGMGAIVLVPEISLTPQTVARFRSHFGDLVAVLHSALSEGERYDEWRALRSGKKRVAIGARSAIFAPLESLGAIVVDEEHDGSYKQSEAPRYHARDVAVMRASLSGAACVLGSATPSLESWSNAERGKFRRLSLPERATGASLPSVAVIDLRRRAGTQPTEGGRAEAGGRAFPVLSPRLEEAIQRRLIRREQVILLLNRRGFSPFVKCWECGDVRRCVHCSVSLTYHRVSARLLCHHCRHEEPEPDRCAACGSTDLSFRGLGTEQVEDVVARTYPDARIARMDVDTTSGKWSHHEILGRVERGEVDILLGTQMIAKGLDFPRVTLVGVVNADVGIHLPDFRASERTFQLLSQVAGRAGRGPVGGEVLIQTALPGHYVIRCALEHDFEGFARRELAERRNPAYPPHLRLVNVVVSSPDPAAAKANAEAAARWVVPRLRAAGRSAPALVGPAPSPIEKLHGRWRWHFFLRSPSSRRIGELARALAFEFQPRGSGDVRVIVDRDPTALL